RPGKGWGRYYHDRLTEVYSQAVSRGQRVLEIGCGLGDLLAAMEPSRGVGVDFSPRMVDRAKQKHPELDFYLSDAHELVVGEEKFDTIILSDLLNDVWDVQTIFGKIAGLCHPGTRILINSYSRLWEQPLNLAEKLGLAQPVLFQNWLTIADIQNLLSLSGFEVIRTWQEILMPLPIPIVANIFNRFLAKIWPLNHLALTNFILARPISAQRMETASVSIIVPARNEEGNIERIFSSLPAIEGECEVIFIEGNSRDNTFAEIERCIFAFPQVRAKLLRQTGTGKGNAVRLGFEHAQGDILMILDADLTVPAHYLVRFYQAIRSGKGEFINGVRLVYPMEKEAMRFVNFLGNKFFGLLFTWLIGQPVKDTLCGTKVLWREDYLRIAKNRSVFGDFDPFGDFDLLFGAARLGLKIVDLPIRYRERTYGTTNISRWRHGLLLLRMALIAAIRLKFI
ncbi:MAG: glycosyltransferase, partial [Anaerolineaceae bacterium]|nr:glycosyltransferase [Anaerolineaceae bacterium]